MIKVWGSILEASKFLGEKGRVESVEVILISGSWEADMELPYSIPSRDIFREVQLKDGSEFLSPEPGPTKLNPKLLHFQLEKGRNARKLNY